MATGRSRVDLRQVGEACLSGCTNDSGAPIRATRPRVICDKCFDRLEEHLLALPGLWLQLSAVVARGSLQDGGGGGGGKPTKQAHAPLPIRAEVASLLDTRGDETIVGILARWSYWVRAMRGLKLRPLWDHPDLRILRPNLQWMASQVQVAGFQRDVARMHRQMRWALGEHPPAAVGTCGAQIRDGEEVQVCGGPLLPMAHAVGVRCGWCGDSWAEEDLRGLGHLLRKRWVPLNVAAYVSHRPEATVRDWQASGNLPAICDLRTRQLQVDALTLAALASSRQRRRRRTA